MKKEKKRKGVIVVGNISKQREKKKNKEGREKKVY